MSYTQNAAFFQKKWEIMFDYYLFFNHSNCDLQTCVFGPPGSGSTSQKYGSGSFYHAKILIKTLILLFCDSFWLFIFEKWCKCTFEKYYAEKIVLKISFLLASWRSVTKLAGSGYISQRHGSADPDPPQNVMDPQHWFKSTIFQNKSGFWTSGYGSLFQMRIPIIQLKLVRIRALL